MTRITKSDVMVQLDGVNELLSQMDETYRIEYNGRYGYNVIERVMLSNGCPLGDPMVAGTHKECYSYACALLRGMWIARREY